MDEKIVSESVGRLDVDQTKSYQAAMEWLIDARNGQLIMFISGESGTGKSQLARVIAQGAQLLFDANIQNESVNEAGNRDHGSVICTAPTGYGAFKIGGHVWFNLLEKSMCYFPKELSSTTILKLQDRFVGVHMFVLDDLNMVSLEDLYEIHFRLCMATGDFTNPFGGLHVVMAGDFYQMKTFTGTPIVRTDYGMVNSRALQGRALFRDNMTHYACLTVNHRLSESFGPLDGFVSSARLGEVSSLALDELNTKVVSDLHATIRTANPQALWIGDSYKWVNHINELFMQMDSDKGKEAIRLVARHMPSKVTTSRYLDIATKNRLYSVKGGLGGGDGRSRSSIAPLVIDICIGSRVKLTANILPSVGLFNGAMGTVVGLVYRGEGQKTSLLSCLARDEHELPIVLLRMDAHDNSFPISCVKALSRVVPIAPIASRQMIEVNGKRFIRYQVPIALAHARSVLSLAGYSAPHGVVSEVSGAFFGTQYVTLSRTSANQIKLLSPLHISHFNGHSDFRQCVAAEYKRLDSAFAVDTLRRLN